MKLFALAKHLKNGEKNIIIAIPKKMTLVIFFHELANISKDQTVIAFVDFKKAFD